MTQAVQIFKHPDFGDVRIIEIDGKPFFVGKDVAVALDYSNPRDALAKHVPDKFKRVSQIATPGGEQKMTLISEAGMYKLVMRSKLPNAEKFSDWTCEEVLPSIRKTGMYIDPNAPIDPRFLRRIADEIEQRDKKIESLTGEVTTLTVANDELKNVNAKLQAEYDRFLNSGELMTTEFIAKAYGMSSIAMGQKVCELEICFKRGTNYYPTQNNKGCKLQKQY